jgi:hypothetical protein
MEDLIRQMVAERWPDATVTFDPDNTNATIRFWVQGPSIGTSEATLTGGPWMMGRARSVIGLALDNLTLV